MPEDLLTGAPSAPPAAPTTATPPDPTASPAASTEKAGASDTPPAAPAATPPSGAPEGKAPPPGGSDDVYTLPEGMTLDNEALAAAKLLFDELKLPKEQRQKFVDVAAGMIQRGIDAQVKAFEAEAAGWLEQVKQHPEIGGKNLDQSVALANTALARFGSPQLIELLKASGYANHPEFVLAWKKVGEAIAEPPKPPLPRSAPQPEKSAAAIMYGGG